MSRLTKRLGAVAAFAVATAAAFNASALAQETPAPAAEAPASAATGLVDLDSLSLEEVAARLDSDSFDDRQAASEALARRGAEAMPILEKLATQGSRESKSRALDLLIARAKAKAESPSKMSAREALERLAKSADPYASRRAEEALAPPPEEPQVPRIAMNPRGPNFLPIAPGVVPNIRIQAIAQNGGLRIQRRNDNGQETTEVEEGGRKVKIAKSPEGRIEVEIVEKKDGKETAEKFAAKDEAELKTNAPKAYELYKKYAGPGPLQAQIVIGGAAPGGFPGGVPQFAPAPPQIPAFPAPARETKEVRLEALKRMLESIQQHERRIEEQIERLEQEMQAEEAPAEAPEAEEPAAKPEEAPAPPENADRNAGSDAGGGSDD